MSNDRTSDRYRALEFYLGIGAGIGWLFITIGSLALAGGIVLAFVNPDFLGVDVRLQVAISVGLFMFYGLLGLGLLAMTQLVSVFIDIEWNTRMSVKARPDGPQLRNQGTDG